MSLTVKHSSTTNSGITAASANGTTLYMIRSYHNGFYKYIWVKPFTLTIASCNTGVASITVTREDTDYDDEQGNLGEELSSGSTIYYGDTLFVEAYAKTGYEIDQYHTNYIVSGDLTIGDDITATAKTLAAPEVTTTGNTSIGYTFTITNTNDVNVTAVYSIEYERYDERTGTTERLTLDDTLDIGADDSDAIGLQCDGLLGGIVYFTANGYSDSGSAQM